MTKDASTTRVTGMLGLMIPNMRGAMTMPNMSAGRKSGRSAKRRRRTSSTRTQGASRRRRSVRRMRILPSAIPRRKSLSVTATRCLLPHAEDKAFCVR